VETVSVAVTDEEPVTLIEEGESAQDNPGAAPGKTQDRFTVPVNPYRGASVSVDVPDCPGAEMLMAEEFPDKLKSVTVIVPGAEVEPA
jgi:hypothetical protein